MSEVNVPLLRKAVEWAEAEAAKPRAQREWYQRRYAVPAEQVNRECGTCFCIAGFVAYQTCDGWNPEAPEFTLDGKHVAEVAHEALGLPEYHDLFLASNSIKDVRRIAEDIAGERL